MFIKTLLIILSSIVISTNSFAESTNIDPDEVLKDNSLYLYIAFSSKNKELALLPYEKIVIDKTNNNIRYYWTFLINKDSKINFDTIKVYDRIDCTSKLRNRLQANTYLKNQHKDTFETKDIRDSVQYVIPDTYESIAVDLVCNIENLTSEDKKRFILLPKDPLEFLNKTQEIISTLLKK